MFWLERRYSQADMKSRITIGAILLGGALLVACTSEGPASSRLPGPSAAAAAGAVTPSGTPAARVGTAPSGSVPLPLNPVSTPAGAANRCPPVVANPVGCPAPLLPQPIVPQASHARIAFCGFITGGALKVASPAVCGAAFRSGELVTVSLTGRMGSTSWLTTAAADGTFRTAVPTSACRLLPGYLAARGNRGSVSNTLPLIVLVCRRVPS